MRVDLHENVLTTDYLEDNVLHYFTYATEWTDAEHVMKFETPEKAIEWYENNMKGRVIDQGKYWLQEDGEHEENITDEDAVSEWQNIVDCVMYC